jgi:IS30 family transposase
MTENITKKGKHFTEEERYAIYHMRFIEKKSLKEIGEFLGRSKSAVGTEINRNKIKGKYIPMIADKKYQVRIHKGGFYKIESDERILNYMIRRLEKDKWSPDVIAAKMVGDIGLSVSTETIYNYIYNSEKSKSLELYKLLPSRKSVRVKHGSRKKKQTIPDRISIHQREVIAEDKVELGHVETDLTFNKGNQSMNIAVMVDKKSHKAYLTLNNSKKADIVAQGLIKRIKEIPKHLRKTFTIDNGKEFSNHAKYRALGFKTYFCDAYSPWQKGLVEKINSMIHRLFPKANDIKTLTKRKLRKIEDLLNNMPRKILGYKTPNQVWNENM